jgi:predicted N-formylglutamate amidohydrolase
VLISCEHAGNDVPPGCRALLGADARLLPTHRGYDPGALELAFLLAAACRAELHLSTTTRLLVDLNRSLDNPGLFGPSTARSVPAVKARLIREHYTPYRRAVERAASRLAAPPGGVDHVSVHTFTPVLRGVRRTVDVGLLFDPARPREASLARRWAAALRRLDPRLNVKMNTPYKGTDDGLTTHLRARLPDSVYAGLELEVNQRFVRAGGERWLALQRAIARSLIDARATQPPPGTAVLLP